jgi:hypothetical protein
MNDLLLLKFQKWTPPRTQYCTKSACTTSIDQGSDVLRTCADFLLKPGLTSQVLVKRDVLKNPISY